jgi:hypothetical protein
MGIVIITILAYSAFVLLMYVLNDEDIIDDDLMHVIIGGPLVWLLTVIGLVCRAFASRAKEKMTPEERKAYNIKANTRDMERQKKAAEKSKKYWTVKRQSAIAKQYFAQYEAYSKKHNFLPAFNGDRFVVSSMDEYDALGELRGVSWKTKKRFCAAYYANREQMARIVESLSRAYTDADYKSEYGNEDYGCPNIKGIRVVNL